MLDILAAKLDELRALCERFEVLRIEVFGSAAKGEFDPVKSDLDFLVAFRRKGTLSAADRYLGLLMALEDLYARRIDLIDVRAARNPYFMAEALKHRDTLYAA